MTQSKQLRVSDERIRDLCVRVASTNGPDFQAAVTELANAIDLRLSAAGKNDEKRLKQS